MDTLQIYQDGAQSGTLELAREGLYLRCVARCRSNDGDSRPCRLWAIGEQGEIALGIPVPEGGKLVLRRRIACRETTGAGLLLRGELRRLGEEKAEIWSPETAPERWARDELLRAQLRKARGTLMRQEGNARLLALPFGADIPFPLEPLFCFAVLRKIGDATYAVFRFDAGGEPLMW